jgi:hypothetical protein
MSATTSAGARLDLLAITLVTGGPRGFAGKIVAVNAWNTIVLTSRARTPGSYQP